MDPNHHPLRASSRNPYASPHDSSRPRLSTPSTMSSPGVQQLDRGTRKTERRPTLSESNPDEIRRKLENVLGDKNKFMKSARASFKQFDFDKSDSLSFPECRALIDRLIVNLSLPPIDDNTLRAIFEKFNSSEGDEMNSSDFSLMFWQILWRVREKYYPTKSICVRRSFFVGRVALGDNQIKKIFAFIKKLGAGSFGEVHLVKEKTSGLERCCKIINKDKAAVPIEQIEAEVQVLKTLDHPNVIKIYEVYEDYNNLYIIQEVCEGGEILKRVTEAAERGKLLTEKYVKELISALLQALAYIHDQNVVHKDLKPENILFQSTEIHSEIKVIDFGLAEIFNRADDTSNNAAGTVLYMAPEVFQRRVTMKCDLWSAGCIMFLLLTGHLPFNGRSISEVKNKIMRQEPAYDTLCAHLSANALNLLQCLLRKNPRQRMSARDALNHPWIISHTQKDVELDASVCVNLKKYTKHSGLKAALINLMTHQLNFNGAQIKKLSDLFKHMDTDNSGTLSCAELATGLAKTGMNPWEINKIVQALDLDGSGDISYTEFLAAAYTWRESELNVMWTAFSKLDRDHDGKISVDEFVELLNGDGTTKLLQQSDVAELLRSVDANGDGLIDWDEFLAYMRSD